MIRLTSRPATLPASLVAWRWSSLKYAGTVITALSTVSPRYASASVLSFPRIIAEISGGENCLPPASTRASPLGPEPTLYGTIDSSVFTSASLRPMKRLIEKTVFCGLVTAWRLATVPTSLSPDCVNATTEGVVRPPSAFSITVGSPPSSTAMQLLVVPRSIPIVFPISALLLFSRKSECEHSRSECPAQGDQGSQRPGFARASALKSTLRGSSGHRDLGAASAMAVRSLGPPTTMSFRLVIGQ